MRYLFFVLCLASAAGCAPMTMMSNYEVSNETGRELNDVDLNCEGHFFTVGLLGARYSATGYLPMPEGKEFELEWVRSDGSRMRATIPLRDVAAVGRDGHLVFQIMPDDTVEVITFRTQEEYFARPSGLLRGKPYAGVPVPPSVGQGTSTRPSSSQ